MSSLGKAVVLLAVILALGAGLVFWKSKQGGHGGEFSSLSKAEMEVLLKDANPMLLKRLADNPEMKKQQTDNLKQLLALASEAQKDSKINTISTRRALDFIDAAVWAQSYDQEINKDKGPMPPFGFITEDMINQYYGDPNAESFFGSGTSRRRQSELDQFVALNVEIMKKSKATKEDATPNEEELKQFRQQYAQVKIYEEEAKKKAKENALPADFVEKTEVQSKLQRAQFLARQYQEVLAERTKVTDEDIAKYKAEHPEISTGADKKAKAEEILTRAKNGEDFAALAKEFSEDPGSKDKGGLYEGVVKKQMVPEFENAALSVQPGEIVPTLVETNYGYHIIKLEKKGETKDSAGQVSETYDARHILISTMMKDPDNPMAREMPVNDFIKQKLETEKEKAVLDQIMASNKIFVAEDFTIPPVSEEELQKMMQKQFPQMQEAPEEPAKTDPKKPAPKKAK